MPKKNEKKFISPGSIGAKIRKLREYRGMSQKELGLRCGFSENTADVRVRQYESNSKIPRQKAIKMIAKALNVDESSLFDADFYDMSSACHALFDLENFIGLYPVKINGKYYLEFDEHKFKDKKMMDEFLQEWMDKRNAIYIENSKEIPSDDIKKYDLWKYEYRFEKDNF